MIAVRTRGTSSKSSIGLVVSLALAGGLILVCCQVSFADVPPSRKRILLLHHYGRETLAVVRFDQGFDEVIQSAPLGSIEVYRETLESYRFPGERHEQLVRHYLKEKFADRKLDVIVTFADTSRDFAMKYRDELFPGVPIIYLVSKRPGPEASLSTGVWAGPNIKETLEVALQLQPATEQVFVISGPLNDNRSVEDEAQEQLKEFATRIRFTYLFDRPLDEVLATVRNLPVHSVILCQR